MAATVTWNTPHPRIHAKINKINRMLQILTGSSPYSASSRVREVCLTRRLHHQCSLTWPDTKSDEVSWVLIRWASSMLTGLALELGSDQHRQAAAGLRRSPRAAWIGGSRGRKAPPAHWKTARGHRLSGQEHYVLFSARHIDSAEHSFFATALSDQPFPLVP